MWGRRPFAFLIPNPGISAPVVYAQTRPLGASPPARSHSPWRLAQPNSGLSELASQPKEGETPSSPRVQGWPGLAKAAAASCYAPRKHPAHVSTMEVSGLQFTQRTGEAQMQEGGLQVPRRSTGSLECQRVPNVGHSCWLYAAAAIAVALFVWHQQLLDPTDLQNVRKSSGGQS